MTAFFIIASILVVLTVGALFTLSLAKAAANDYGPAAERDSRENLEETHPLKNN